MNPDWSFFSKWEFSDGNKWSPMKARGLRKAWKYTVQGELKQLIPGGEDNCLVAFSGKDSVVRLDLAGREVWKTALFEGGPPMKEYFLSLPYMIDGAWFYRETLFAQMAGVAPIQLNPETGEVLRRTKLGIGEDPFHPDRGYHTSLYLDNGKWITTTGPTSLCEIKRTGCLELLELVPLPLCLGWRGAQCDGKLVPPLMSNVEYELTGRMPVAELSVRVQVFCGNKIVFVCFESGATNRHLRIAKDGDYFSAFVVRDAVDAFITGDECYLVTKHHDENRRQWWLECRRLNDPEQVLWRTDPCGWMTWFMGTGDTVWHTEWSGPDVKGKDWLIGRDLITGAEIYRKAEACRFMGLFCGPLIITASGRSITAWEPVA